MAVSGGRTANHLFLTQSESEVTAAMAESARRWGAKVTPASCSSCTAEAEVRVVEQGSSSYATQRQCAQEQGQPAHCGAERRRRRPARRRGTVEARTARGAVVVVERSASSRQPWAARRGPPLLPQVPAWHQRLSERTTGAVTAPPSRIEAAVLRAEVVVLRIEAAPPQRRPPTPPRADPAGESEHEGEKGGEPAARSPVAAEPRCPAPGGERSRRGARAWANGHVGSDVAVHVGSQTRSKGFWTSSDTLK